MHLKFKIFTLVCFFVYCTVIPQKYITVNGTHFQLDHKPYYFVGTNYWYSSFLGLEANHERGIGRLQKELDFLKSQNITNIRVLAAVEGSGMINGKNRVSPPYQYNKGKFDENVLRGLDILMDEAARRDFKVVLYLSNNWEWSGGWLQYLNWNGKISDESLQRNYGWDEWRDNTSKFYECSNCQKQYFEQVRRIVTRKNSINGKKYNKDKTLMAWEIANEPRPMRPAANENYKIFLQKSSAFIKSLDNNHLVTTGSEGEMGTEGIDLYKATHKGHNIDYLTIHIWPKNWGWIGNHEPNVALENSIAKTQEYIKNHIKIADELQKPMVLEEFGFPRDGGSFDIQSATKLRDAYFETVLKIWNDSKLKYGSFSGISFWSFGGYGKPIKGQIFWKNGDDYVGDPPVEEQGLNSVFATDFSTWEILRKSSK